MFGEPPKLSIILPVFDEHDSVGQLITKLVRFLEASDLACEIIAVDDGSADRSGDVLQGLASQFPDCLRIVRHPYNKGNGAAIKTGIRVARGELIACMDADGQHDPSDLARMLPFMTEFDLVIGARAGNSGEWYRNLANRAYSLLASWLADFPIEDLTSGYRLFRAPLARKYAHLFPARFSYPTTSTLIFLKAGHNIKYVPVHVVPRQGGVSKVKILSDGWRFLIIILKIVILYEPLRVFGPIATTSLLMAVLLTAYNTYLLHSFRVPNSGVVLLVLSVLVLLMGLISEQIAALQISSSGTEEG